MRALAVLAGAWVLGALGITWAGFSREEGAGDVAVVLGNEVYGDGTLAPRTQARVAHAAQLYREGRVRAVLVSGGTGDSGVNEAVAMARAAVALGVPQRDVVEDREGNTTLHTARNARAIMQQRGWTRAVAVSQFFHVPRTVGVLRACGVPEVEGSAADYTEWRDLYAVLREVPALLRYRWRGCPPEREPAQD